MADSVVFVDLPQGSDVITVQSDFWRKDQVKMVNGAWWDDERKLWTVPLAWSTCITLRGIFGKDLMVGPGLTT